MVGLTRKNAGPVCQSKDFSFVLRIEANEIKTRARTAKCFTCSSKLSSVRHKRNYKITNYFRNTRSNNNKRAILYFVSLYQHQLEHTNRNVKLGRGLRVGRTIWR